MSKNAQSEKRQEIRLQINVASIHYLKNTIDL